MIRLEEPLNVPMKLLIPKWKKVNGVSKKIYPKPEEVPEENIIYGSVKTFGGTIVDNNGVVGIENTATVKTWYRPDIKADCRIILLNNNAVYDIMGDPEDIEMRNQFLQMKVKRIGGKNG